MSAIDSATAIEAALAGKTRGFRGPKGERQMVEVTTGDVIAVARDVDEPDQIVKDLLKGSEGVSDSEAKATIYADDAFHLLEEFAG